MILSNNRYLQIKHKHAVILQADRNFLNKKIYNL